MSEQEDGIHEYMQLTITRICTASSPSCICELGYVRRLTRVSLLSALPISFHTAGIMHPMKESFPAREAKREEGSSNGVRATARSD